MNNKKNFPIDFPLFLSFIIKYFKSKPIKRLLLLFTSLLTMFYMQAQEKMSCCAPAATEEYALNALNKNCARVNEKSMPFTVRSAKGKSINYASLNDKEAHAF